MYSVKFIVISRGETTNPVFDINELVNKIASGFRKFEIRLNRSI